VFPSSPPVNLHTPDVKNWNIRRARVARVHSFLSVMNNSNGLSIWKSTTDVHTTPQRNTNHRTGFWKTLSRGPFLTFQRSPSAWAWFKSPACSDLVSWHVQSHGLQPRRDKNHMCRNIYSDSVFLNPRVMNTGPAGHYGVTNELENIRSLQFKSAHNLLWSIVGTAWVFWTSAIHWLLQCHCSSGVCGPHATHSQKHVAQGGGVHRCRTTHSSFLSHAPHESVTRNCFTRR